MRGKKQEPASGTRRYCPNCGERTGSGDRYCRSCGTSLTDGRFAERVPMRLSGLRLVGLGIIVLAGLWALLYYGYYGVGTLRETPPPSQPIPFSDVGTGGGAAPPSALTGREMADQLYNQAMMAHETGDSASAERFVPMALAAYRGLDALDLDARYHVAVLSLAAGRPDAALAQADTMLAQVPNHLLALAVGARVYEEKGDDARARDYYRRFLEAYTPGAAASRPEYLEHAQGLSTQLEAARRLVRQDGQSQ